MLNLQEVKARLPHRAPILLIDQVTAWEADTYIEAERSMPKGDPLFEGHFPDYPIFPGVLGVEALAQAGALLTNLTDDYTAQQTQFLFMGVQHAKFRHPIVPEDTLTLKVTQVNRKGEVFKFEGEVWVKDTLCTQAGFTAKRVLKAA